MTPYYQDDLVTLYHGDCREVLAWLDADVLVTDPPYGRRLEIGGKGTRPTRGRTIAGDDDTAARDAALKMWGVRPAVVFGDLMLPPPAGTKQVLVYRKAPNSGVLGTFGGFRRDIEAVYLLGTWVAGHGGRSALLTSGARNTFATAGRYQHPHAKPADVLCDLVSACPAGIVADSFAGSGSTLIAAKLLGRHAVGVEIDERYCEVAARRLAQDVIDFGEAS